MKHINLTLEARLIPAFFQLLQDGFLVEGNVECSVRVFLCEQLGLDAEYLEKRIQTIFLNGRPVDDVETAIVRNGATLSLSAALPGLAGAVMRKGGYYAPMRDQISCKGEISLSAMRPGRVLIKLFNLPLYELGPVFLDRGVRIRGDKLKDVLTAHVDDLRTGCKKALIDGRQFDALQLPEADWKDGEVFLEVKSP